MTHRTVAALPSDETLTRDGAQLQEGDAPLLLIACGALAREVLALKELNGWQHMDLICLPAILHNHPEKIPAAVAEKVAAHRDRYDRILVLYADCGTGGLLQAECDRLGVGMLEGPHCYAFFEGLEIFADREELTAFYLTDFLARQFEAFVWQPLGLDRHPDLLPVYFGHYESLVYLAQTEDEALTRAARSAADRMGLRFERRFTGYGGLATALEQEVSQ